MIKLYIIAAIIIVIGILAYLFTPINVRLYFPLNNKTRDDITSVFGFRTHPITKQWQFHNGIDVKAYEGEQIYAVYDGIVKFAGYYDELSGNKIVIEHPGFYSHYAHLKDIFVKVGDKVKLE